MSASTQPLTDLQTLVTDLETLTSEAIRRQRTNHIRDFYPDTGPLRRELYPKHLEFFKLGAEYRERLALAANRVGKTEGIGGYELTLHLTGQYPDWWEGRRFDKPIRAWAGGDTGGTVRDIIQRKLLGPVSALGTGLIPEDTLGRMTKRMGIPDAYDTVEVKHVSGGMSLLGFKSYAEGRTSWQGTEQDVIWLDEEAPLSIYLESLVRLMTTQGVMLATFTPLSGLTELVMAFLPGGKLQENKAGTKAVVMATWDDVPHLSAEDKEQLYESIPPYQRDARSKGVPQLGSGAIYPVPESEFVVEPFKIPEWWPRAYALDVGWNRTAVLWAAWDQDSDVLYFYSEHYQGQAEPSVHAAAIRARGEWIPGVVDPNARGRSQKDGTQLLKLYRDLGLKLGTANNAVEAGIFKVWERMSQGRLKVFSNLVNYLFEFRIYRRDDKGKIVKEHDHLLDAKRYLVMSGMQRACVEFASHDEEEYAFNNRNAGPTGY